MPCGDPFGGDELMGGGDLIHGLWRPHGLRRSHVLRGCGDALRAAIPWTTWGVAIPRASAMPWAMSCVAAFAWAPMIPMVRRYPWVAAMWSAAIP